MSNKKGHLHPLTLLTERIVDTFTQLGFNIAEGPELEQEKYNFDDLNLPPNHPARDMQDTFWIKGIPHTVLRTHTSPVQIRAMLEGKPPYRVITIGRAYRNEAVDATHEAQFYQFEGLVIDKNITLAHLKWTLETFFASLLGGEVKVRFRPSFFSFVEPGVEVDIECFQCDGGGCALCKSTGWIEVMGAGIVHPHVLRAGGLDPTEYQGFAFGLGMERVAMPMFKIPDIRHFYSGDLRFIDQF